MAFAAEASELLGVEVDVVTDGGLSADATELHPEVPWPLIKRMRDRLAHHYEGTGYEAVWDTMVVDLPTTSRYVQAI